jgi:acrylyl-CoA reductase (NADPH)/3-hydroxypropionyl-CoA dehydratase/3-hydroxypropionyl-CoA synthetase
VWGDGARVGQAAWRGDLRRFTEIYFDRWSERGSDGRRVTWAYTQGDYACRYEDGSLTLHGRSDDVINTSGHRLGTEEIEGAILKDKQQNPKSPVGNAIVVGAPHKEKGTGAARVHPHGGRQAALARRRAAAHGARARGEGRRGRARGLRLRLAVSPRRAAGSTCGASSRTCSKGEPLGDTTTLRNPESLDEIKRAIARWQARAALEEEQQLLTLYSTLRLEVHEVLPESRWPC